jgi:putative CRISPR-associated protein (TIGR02619 family)
MEPDEASEAYSARIEARLRKMRAEQPALTRASAEINALVRAGAQPQDDIAFLISETEDARVCGRHLAALAESDLDCRTKVVEIKGLQVRDGRTFRQVGVSALFAAMDALTRDRSRDEVQLNVTGGFKGTVPYVVLYGMFRGFPVSYVYEFSDTLITLPTLPLEFDWERLMPAQEAILTLLDEGAVHEGRWRELLPPDYSANQDRYDALFEFDGGLVTLSAIGFLMKARLETLENRAEVLLSPRARSALQTAGPEIRVHFDSMLSRVRSPWHRSGYRHAESLHKTDLKVWKVYTKSGPRMLYWTEGGRVYIGELFARHDDYESYGNGNPLRRADYKTTAFTQADPVTEPNYREVLADIRRGNDEPAERARAIEEEVRALKTELQQLRAEHNEIRRDAHVRAQIAAGRAAEKAERRVRVELDTTYGTQLRAKDDEIVRREAIIGELEAEIGKLLVQIVGDGSASGE